jgi:hypothetical protein
LPNTIHSLLSIPWATDRQVSIQAFKFSALKKYNRDKSQRDQFKKLEKLKPLKKIDIYAFRLGFLKA